MTLRDGVPESFSNVSFFNYSKSLIVVNLPCICQRPGKRGIIERMTDNIIRNIHIIIHMIL